MPPIRLVAIDLDDTLLTPDLRIAPACREAVQAVRARGVQVVLATGRMFCSAAPYARQLGLGAETPIIAYNGGLVQTLGGELWVHEPVPLPEARELARYAINRGLCLNLYINDTLYVQELGPHVAYYVSIAGVQAHPVGDLLAFLQAPPTKMLIVDEAERIEALLPELREAFAGRLDVARSKPRYIEVTAPGVSKGRALAAVAARLGVPAEQVMAIGDGENDAPMLRWAGLGVAVANAMPAAKAAADVLTLSNAEGGVGAALRRYVLGQPGDGPGGCPGEPAQEPGPLPAGNRPATSK